MLGIPVFAIVAMDEGRVIGKDGALPWHLPEDLAHFKSLTTGQVVIMGRKTWESLPARFRPLPGRRNIVVSRTPGALNLPEGVGRASSVEEAIERARKEARSDQSVWVIGGAELYRASLPVCQRVYLTVVTGHYDGDATLAPFEEAFTEISSTPGERCVFKVYERR